MISLLLAVVSTMLVESSTEAQSFKILVVPQPVKSHVFPMASISESLAARGHDVTFLIGKSVADAIRQTEAEDDGSNGVKLEVYDDDTSSANLLEKGGSALAKGRSLSSVIDR